MASKSVGTSQLDHNEAYTTRVAKILKDWENPRASEDVGQLEVSYAAVAGGVWTGTITSEDRQDCTEGCAYVHILGPRNSIPEHTPAQMRQNRHKNIHSSFIHNNSAGSTQMPSVVGWINKMWSILTTQRYLAMTRNERLLNVAWMNLTDKISSKGSQAGKVPTVWHPFL